MKALAPMSRWLDRLSVRQQLFGSFISLLLLTAVLGGSALVGLRSVDAEALALSSKWLKGVGDLSDARSMLVEYRDLEVRHGRTDDKSYHAEYEAKMGEVETSLKGLFDGYQTRVVSDEEAALKAEVDKAWAGYRDAASKVVKLGQDKLHQDAADVSDGLAAMAFDETVASINKLIQYNNTGGEAAATTVKSVYAQARIGVLGILGVALVFGVGVATLITRRLLRQLGGEPRTAVAVARAVAEGDLGTSITLRTGDSTSLLAWLSTMQQSLSRAVSDVRHSSDHVSHASEEIAAGNQDLSGRTEQQASELQQTAATMEQLGSTVKVNAENALQASQLAQGASAVAVRGGDVVGRVVETMKGINESSRRIGDIIGVIDGIAFQTNILALNAAVEAARAGEQGRGFAVVAGEVRNLAQRSAEAAKEIKGLIGASVERVEQGSKLVDEAGVTMNDVVNSIRKVSDIVSGISMASAEQSAGVAQVGEAISRMDQGTQQNAALVEQSAAAAEALKQQAQQLVKAVSVFRVA